MVTPADALEWAKLGLTLGQWGIGLIIELANASRRSAVDVKRAEERIPDPLRSIASLAAQRLVAQREIAITLNLDAPAQIAATAEALRSIGWDQPERWARALFGQEFPPRVEIPTNPFAGAEPAGD